jgi:hypothetical protein
MCVCVRADACVMCVPQKGKEKRVRGRGLDGGEGGERGKGGGG